MIAPAAGSYIWRKKKSAFTLPPMALPLLAAVTPREITVQCLDEAVADVDLNLRADLVGLSVMTANAPRGYALADHFRSRGLPVVMGGIHVSSLPEEALTHCDAVAVGEGEHLWPQVLADASRGRLRPIYKNENGQTWTGFPTPRWEMLAQHKYFIPRTVQVSRGCPVGCSFCSVSSFFGRNFRTKPVEKVLAEVRQVPRKLLVFVDDNLVGNPEYAKELFEALIPFRKKWVAQCSLSVAEDRELLALAARSGCIGMLIGFESLSVAAMARIGKKVNLRQSYDSAIRKIHERGIQIQGSFIFGFDEDRANTVDETLEFVRRNKLSGANYCLLTPFPGTRLFDELEQEGRILSRDWLLYDRNHVVYHPAHFLPEDLRRKTEWAYRQTYNLRSLWNRRPITFQHYSLYLALNFGYWRGVRKGKG
ncbi:MAG: B12-binding domain-containing radical SAM protein [Deltaproteobacteria bacterium]|nr:B12-binding domain-containing radical SAM protein [Deltaproteobacteria bacterium]